jgi:hypothetical protein
MIESMNLPCGSDSKRKVGNRKEVNDLASVDAVPSQAVGVPSEDAFRFAGLKTRKHVVEERSSWRFGRLLFDEFGHDGDVLAFGEFAKFCELSFDGEDLLVLDIG